MKGAVVAILVAMAMAYFVATPSHALTCFDVDACMLPCVGYLTGKETTPSAECCAGVKRLKGLPTNTAERRSACDCVKKAAAHVDRLKNDAVRDLPALCGAPLPFPLSLNFDCSIIP